MPVAARNASASAGKATLPAGDYRLYVLSDGAPARVTIDLPNIQGTAELEPTHITSMRAQALPRLDGGESESFAVFGGSGELHGAGALLDTSVVYQQPHVATIAQSCWYIGKTAGALAFFPGCPASDGDHLFFSSVPNPQVWVTPGRFSSGSYTFSTGENAVVSVGGNIQSAADVQSMGWASFFVDFEGTPLPPRTSSPAPPPPPAASPAPAPAPAPPALAPVQRSTPAPPAPKRTKAKQACRSRSRKAARRCGARKPAARRAKKRTCGKRRAKARKACRSRPRATRPRRK
jgi:hypothetical protein